MSKLQWLGVSLSSAESDGPAHDGPLPGAHGTDYVYPPPDHALYFRSKGINLIRLPFLWERLQTELGRQLDDAELARLQAQVDHMTGAQLHVLLDPHNYARYVLPSARGLKRPRNERGSVIGSADVPVAAFTDFWGKLAEVFRGNPNVSFGLMNEPHTMLATEWVEAANAAIQAIRATGARNAIAVPGIAWSGAHSWTTTTPGSGMSNAEAMASIVNEPNLVIEVHQYLDKDFSGSTGDCPDPAAGVRSLETVTRWLRANRKRGFLGEFGGADNSPSRDAITRMLEHMEANADVWHGWAWWGAGPWWANEYPFLLRPAAGGVDRPQMQLLAPYLNA